MKKKFFVVIAIIAVLVILLTPVRMNLKDGGSVRYKALVYEVTKIHQLAPEVDGVKPYIDGFEIKILGMTVYRETNEQTNSSLSESIQGGQAKWLARPFFLIAPVRVAWRGGQVE